MKIIIKPLDQDTWDIYRTPAYSRRRDIDCHLRYECGGWMLMVFDSYKERDTDAHREDIPINRCPTGPNWNQVIIAVTEFKHP